MAGITLSNFNGIDFSSVIETLMQYESQPLNAVKAEQTKIRNKDSAFVSLGGLVSALQDPVNSLLSSKTFSTVGASSTDTSIATVVSGPDSSVGQYNVSITQLAKAQVTKSTSGYSAMADTAATGGSISFTINGTTTTAIDITSATTLSELKDKINGQNSGVIASIVNDGTNYKLVISSRETGETNGFTINNSLTNGGGTALNFAAGQNATTGNAQNAQNALLNVNGIDIVSAANKVVDAIPGATLSLLKPGDVSVNVTNDYSPIKDKLKTIVAQYNKLRQFYTDQTKGALGSDPVLREVLTDIKAVLLTANSNGGRYTYLSEIGLELTSNGDLKLDETKLDAAITSFTPDLQKLFQGATGTDGVLNALKSALNNLDSTAGLIKTTRDNIKTTLGKYDDRITQQEAMLELRRVQLVKMYAAADEAMSQLNKMSSAITNLRTF
jgi:flagellar hook-associated protein 2